MQISSSSQMISHYDIEVDDKNKTYEIIPKSQPRKNYDEVLTTLKKIEMILKENFQSSTYSKDMLLEVYKRMCESGDLFSDSIFNFLKNKRVAPLQRRIENLIDPPKIFPKLPKEAVHLILSNLTCKDLTCIALLNRDGRQYVDAEIIDRGKHFGFPENYSLLTVRYYLRKLFIDVNKFSHQVIASESICFNGEETLANLRTLAKNNVFVDSTLEGLPLIHFLIKNYPLLVYFFFNKEKVNQKATRGDTPLMLASFYNQELNVRLLLGKGADPNLKDQNGNTALHFVSMSPSNSTTIIKLLLDKGAKINAMNHNGDTPLHLAAIRCNKSVIKFLDSQGVDLNIRNNKGESALTTLANNPKTTYSTLIFI